MIRKKSDVKLIVLALLMCMLILSTAGTAAAEESNWHIGLSYLYLMERAEGEVLFENRDNGDELDTEDLLVGWGDRVLDNIGWQAEIGYTMPSKWALTFIYMGRLAEGSDSLKSDNEEIYATFGDVDSPGPYIGEFDQAGEVKLFLETDLHSFELNIHMPPWQLSQCTSLNLFFGPRFIWLEDELDIKGDDSWPPSGSNVAEIEVDTENYLYVLQGGLGYTWEYCGWFRFFTGIKAGIYYADLSNEVDFADADGNDWKLKDDDDDFGFLGEAMVSAEIKLYKNLSARLGYMLLYLSDTCRGTNQIQEGMNFDEDLSNISSSDYPDVESDYTFYHGFVGGIVWRW